jgi:hypothetical protein
MSAKPYTLILLKESPVMADPKENSDSPGTIQKEFIVKVFETRK